MFKTLLDQVKAARVAYVRRRATKRYERGYKVAMRCLNAYKVRPEELYGRTVFQEAFMQHYTEFHSGIRAACYDYQAQDRRIEATVKGTY